MDDNLQDVMQPQVGSDMVSLPITFDYNGGRSESTRTRKVLAWMFGIIFFLIGLGILFRGSQGFFVRLLIVGFLYTAIFYFIRFVLLRENRLRKQYYEQLDNDYKLSTEDIWGIYDIEGEEVKAAHYRNGKIGIFFKLEKDVIVGLDVQAEHDHYEAIANAYNEAARNNATICHIDYMAHVGKDKRIHTLYGQVAQTKNPELRAVLNGMFSHLDSSMQDEISTFDAYVVLLSSTESRYFSIANSIIKQFMQGNYLGYSTLDDSQLRDLTVEIFNLHSFSAVDAQRNALVSSTFSVAVPISIERDGVVTKLNKTVKERRDEEAEKRRLNELIRKEKKRRSAEERKSRKKSKTNNKVEEASDEFIEL